MTSIVLCILSLGIMLGVILSNAMPDAGQTLRAKYCEVTR